MASLLIIDPSADARLNAVFSQAGFEVQSVTDVAQALAATPPTAVLLRAELASAATRELLMGLRRRFEFAQVPVILLSRDASDTLAAARFRSGVVEILSEPFDEASHPERVKRALASLSSRTGVIEASDSLSRFLNHVRKSLRSGQLVVAAGTQEEGRATFVEGVLQQAQRMSETGDVALLSMLSSRARWKFTEATSPAPAPPRPTTSMPAVPLLLVDDDADLRTLFTTYLQKHGFEVVTARDGNEGFELALTRHFGAIVADLNMPGLDGWGMLRKLRTDYRTREIPVAVLSAHDDYREALKAKSSGARFYLAKGNRLEPLAQEVEGLLEPRRTFLANVVAGKPASVSLAEAGPQWTLRALERVKATGALEAEDGWARYSLSFRNGELISVKAVSGKHTAEAARALTAFIGSEQAEAAFVANAPAPASNISGPLEPLIAQAQSVLNRNALKTQEALLVNGKTVSVDPDLYALYAQLGPKESLETARLFCEELLTAREVIARSERSPLEIEEVLQDLVRRGVVQLGG